MLFVLAVSKENSHKWSWKLRRSNLPADTQTAIFAETTSHMTPFEVLQRRHPFNGPGFPSDIAKMAVVLASDDVSWVTGVCLPVDGGYTAR